MSTQTAEISQTNQVQGELHYRAIIADDEIVARDRLRALLLDHGDFEIIAECADGEQLSNIVRGMRPDLVFLDVEMPGIDGISAWRSIEVNPQPAMVLTTAHSKFALDGFDLNATDYLLKPYSRDRFAEALRRVRVALRDPRRSTASSVAGAPKDRIVLKHDGEFHFVRTSDVVWVEAEKDFTKVHALNGVHLIRKTLSGVEETLDRNQFLRIHRSHIINQAHIEKVSILFHGDYLVAMSNGEKLRVSRPFVDDVRRILR